MKNWDNMDDGGDYGDMSEAKALIAKLKNIAEDEGCSLEELIEKVQSPSDEADSQDMNDMGQDDGQDSMDDGGEMADEEPKEKPNDKIALIVARMKAKKKA